MKSNTDTQIKRGNTLEEIDDAFQSVSKTSTNSDKATKIGLFKRYMFGSDPKRAKLYKNSGDEGSESSMETVNSVSLKDLAQNEANKQLHKLNVSSMTANKLHSGNGSMHLPTLSCEMSVSQTESILFGAPNLDGMDPELASDPAVNRKQSVLTLKFEELYQRKLVIHPNSSFKVGWDVLMCIILFYVVLFLPIRVAFEDSRVLLVDIVIDSFFLADMILQFFTAYQSRKGDLITNRKSIAKQYLKCWFWIDLVATFPFYLIDFRTTASRLTRLLRVPRLFKVMRVVKLIKTSKNPIISEMVSQFEENLNVHPGIFRLVKLLFLILLACHTAACIWLAIPVFDFDHQQRSWKTHSNTNGVVELSPIDQYLAALYWAFTAITTVGFGDIFAVTTTERVFSIITMAVGVTFYAYATATVSSILHSFDARQARNRKKIEQLRLFIKFCSFVQYTYICTTTKFNLYII